MSQKVKSHFLPAKPSREEAWKIFDAISKRYDLVNHLISFGADLYWRRKLIAYLPKKTPIHLLDLATGTGSQLLAIIQRVPRVKAALGIDLSCEMIRAGQRKIIAKNYAHRVTLAKGDATAISLSDATIDCVTMSFGIRNVTDVERSLAEAYRVLKKGGRLIILEFSLPKNCLIRTCHLFYLRHILPHIAGWIAHNKDAYRYLNQTIETFPYGNAFCRLMEAAGLTSVQCFPLTFGVVTLYVGDK
ncbi:MAG: bifunctional demethylmenaquinone methyltransferase/2-methoxy-6-polyprenyl-1,4-benzoquinol methylase UbiE [Chlamydiota bacterium]